MKRRRGASRSSSALATARGLAALAGGLAALAAGCGSSTPSTTASGPVVGEPVAEPYLAFSQAFDGYPSWEKHGAPEAAVDPDGGPHFGGPRTVYVYRRPKGEGAGFPVGTLLVKEVASNPPHVFAMVKRGGGYNASGALGWEYFELDPASTTEAKIVWRGVGPPDGENYGGDAAAGCNGCHGAAAATDYVLLPGLAP